MFTSVWLYRSSVTSLSSFSCLIYIWAFSHPSILFWIASFHMWTETWVFVCRNDSAASAFIIYFLSLLSYLKSQPISHAHFKERRKKRRLQAGSSEQGPCLGFSKCQMSFWAGKGLSAYTNAQTWTCVGYGGIFSRIWSALLCAKERSEIEWANVTFWNLNWRKCVLQRSHYIFHYPVSRLHRWPACWFSVRLECHE